MKTKLLILFSFIFVSNLSKAQSVQQQLNEGKKPLDLLKKSYPVDSLYGKRYQGGLIFYVDNESGYTLVSAEQDQSSGSTWGCAGAYLNGTDATAVKNGANNSLSIVRQCSDANTAAYICENLVLNGYEDWYLPSRDELNAMYVNLKSKGFGNFNFSSWQVNYWSSSQYYGDYAWTIRFWDGVQNQYTKTSVWCVRAVRSVGLPSIKTTPVTSLQYNGASAGGNLEGTTNVTSLGICWSTNPFPYIGDNNTSVQVKNGSFQSAITNLSPSTKYYVRSYATNNLGTAYGAVISFTTNPPPPVIPSITTNSITNITSNSATVSASVTSDGRGTISSRGACWSTHSHPTLNDPKTEANSQSGNNFTLDINQLNPKTTYYLRSYASNSAGTAYSNEISFTTARANPIPCPTSPTVTDIDGNVYNTVQLGTQCWMQSNLKTSKYRDGTTINNLPSSLPANYGDIIGYATDNSVSNFDSIYGKLYSALAVSSSHGICPAGWHVPDTTDWKLLGNYLGGMDIAALEMKSGSIWQSCDNSNNWSTFSALPAGYFEYNGNTRNFLNGPNSENNKTSYFFSSVVNGDVNYSYRITICDPRLMPFTADSNYGASVRCIKD